MRKRDWLMGIGLWAVAAAALAQMPQARPWSDVEAIIDSGAPKYDGMMQSIYLAADGRAALVVDEAALAKMREEHADEPLEAPPEMPATLGRHESQGAWRVLTIDSTAYRTEAARAAFVQAMMDEYELESEEQLDEFVASMQGDTPASTMRLLRVPYRGGELLLAEESLMWMAKAWDGQGPLEIRPTAWRIPAAEMPPLEYGFPTFEIDHPLSAGLPIELAGLLRRDAIEGRVVELLDTAENIEWSHHSAKVRVRLDRGANHGMYEGMDVYGLPPDESFFAVVSKTSPEESIAEFHVSRFSPKHPPQLPGAGLRVTTRRAAGTTGCHIDTSAAVRGKVLAVATPAARLAWDDDGFAWVEMTIDQGSRHGLAAGDSLQAEIDEADGEGLVTAVQAERATVLWRVQRYDEEQPVRLPAAGEALVTPAWKRIERETFDSAE